MRDKANWAYVIDGHADPIIASLLMTELRHYRHGSWSNEDLETIVALIGAIREQSVAPHASSVTYEPKPGNVYFNP